MFYISVVYHVGTHVNYKKNNWVNSSNIIKVTDVIKELSLVFLQNYSQHKEFDIGQDEAFLQQYSAAYIVYLKTKKRENQNKFSNFSCRSLNSNNFFQGVFSKPSGNMKVVPNFCFLSQQYNFLAPAMFQQVRQDRGKGSIKSKMFF